MTVGKVVRKPVGKRIGALIAASCSVALACAGTAAPAGAAPTTPTGPAAPNAAAQPVSVVVKGLNGPRQISPYGSRLYVAESDTGQVSLIDPRTGGHTPVLKGLSTPQGVVRVGGKLYAVVGDPAPDASPSAIKTAVVVAKPGHKAKKFADLLAYELKHNPDKQIQFVNGKPVDALSNPYYVIKDRHGFLLVADAGGNDVLKVSRTGKISKFFVPPVIRSGACRTAPNNTKDGYGCDAVPTGLAYGPHGRLYVSALGAEVPGQGRVYVLNGKTGKLIRTIKGLTAPTGVAVSSKGTVFTSEVTEGAPADPTNPPAGFDPSTIGQIVRTTAGGRRSYAQVPMPSGLVFAHGDLYAATVALAGFLGQQNAGQVVHIRAGAFKK